MQWQYKTSILIIFVVKMDAGWYRYITLRSSSSVCPSPDTILPFFFFFLFMFWNKRLYWALWHIFWSYYQGKQENSGRVIYQTSSFVIHWLLFNTVVPSDMQIWRHRITPIYHITRNANVKILGVYHLKHCFSWICFSYFNSHLAMNRFCFFSFHYTERKPFT